MAITNNQTKVVLLSKAKTLKEYLDQVSKDLGVINNQQLFQKLPIKNVPVLPDETSTDGVLHAYAKKPVSFDLVEGTKRITFDNCNVLDFKDNLLKIVTCEIGYLPITMDVVFDPKTETFTCQDALYGYVHVGY